MHGSIGRATGLVVALSLAALPTLSSAESSQDSLLNNTFKVDLGTFLVSSDTKVRIDGDAGEAGTEIDFDSDIDYGDQTRLRLDAYWRFAEKHKIRLLYFNNSMDRDWTTDREVTIGDSVFPVNATLSTDNKFTVTEVAYEYAFLRKPTWELAATGGIHWIKFSFDVAGEGSCTGGDCEPGGGISFRSENHEANGPLPVLGLHGMWEFSPTWYLDGQAQFFKAKVDKFDGSVVDTRLTATKMFGRNFGVGAGWNRFVTRVDVDDGGDFSGSLHWGYQGFLFYVTGAF
jgi:hypothetical protein